MAFTDRKNPERASSLRQTKPFIILRDMESADAVSIRWKKSRISMSEIIKNGHNEIKINIIWVELKEI